MLALVPYRTLTTGRQFPELVSANLVVRDHQLVAIACSLPHLQWPGRAVYDGRRIRHRLALYDHAHRLIAVFDEAQFPVNDIAFHPTDPVLAIATGSYDGGYAYEGALVIWNWQTDESRSVFDQSREIMRCRWEPDGTLTTLTRPDNDEQYDELYGATLDVSGSCSLDQLRLGVPADFGFDAREPLSEVIEDAPQAVIWDLAWTLDNRLAVARDDGLELWSVATGQREHVIPIGKVVQLLRQPDRLLAHVIGARSELYELRGNELELWVELPSRHACSVAAKGHILARDVDRHTPRRDQLWTASKKLLIEADLGHYDVFNHFLRIDGARELFLLRGTPASSHEHKCLWRIDPGDVALRIDMPWDTELEHRMTSSAVMLDGDLVCCYYVHDSRGGGAKRIERLTASAARWWHGRTIWRREVPASAIAMLSWPAVGGIVAALVDGTLCVITEDGTVLHQERFTIDDVPTIPTALAVHGETLAVGTIDGRISLLSVR